MRPGAYARAAAARILANVAGDGRSLSTALPEGLAGLEAQQDRALVQAMCFGVLRRYHALLPVLGQLLDRPLKRKDHLLRCLLLAGIYQVAEMKVPDHAAVAATVEAAPLIGRKSARGLVNAVLRRFAGDRDTFIRASRDTVEGRYAHPAWMIEAIERDWPEHWQAILAENNKPPPMWLRVNRTRISREDYLSGFPEPAPIAGRDAPDSVLLRDPLEVNAIPGFSDGQVSVQDAGAQLAAHLVAPQPGQRILDACAAPGGKTCHILELCLDAEITAVDISADRLEGVRQNLDRLALDARLVCADVSRTDAWWDGRPFDTILLDAPCTASGVIRRHPDIKLLRRPADLGSLAARQAGLLDALWPTVVRGGRLIYCTCSVFAAETSGQLQRFLSRTRDAVSLPLTRRWGHETEPGRQTLPGEAGMDGFYYACLTKTD